MAGLLYKDFVSVSGKKFLGIIIGLTAVFTVLRIAFPGTADSMFFMVGTEEGETVNLFDYLFPGSFAVLLISVFGIINSWVGKIVEGDDKNKIRGYLRALPLEKNTYVASKYIFIGISAYVFMSVAMIWNTVANAFCGDGMISDALSVIGVLIPFVICLALLSAAIELPMFLTLGKNKAMVIKTAIITLIAFWVIGFLMFGNLAGFEENFNILTFLKWYRKHIFAVSLLNILFPVITLVLYYLSYRIACYFTGRKEA